MKTPPHARDFFVAVNDLRACRIDDAPPLASIALAPGQVVMQIDHFGFTANNVTYARLGERLGYWRAFPAPEGLGRIPVWGFADVVRSANDDVAPGRRVFGYCPMATYAVLDASQVTPEAFVDGAAHRRAMSPFYARYATVDAGAPPDREDASMVLRPFIMTALLLVDFLAEHAFFGAGAVVIASASSKTAMALARILGRRAKGPARIGLTRRESVGFLEGLGIYDRVAAYEDAQGIDVEGKVMYVDFARDESVRRAVRTRLGDRLVYDCVVGSTHWEAPLGDPAKDEGLKREMFFAPSWIAKRTADWGAPGLRARLDEAQGALAGEMRKAMNVIRADGPEAVMRAYREVLEGRARPSDGYILSLSRA